MKKKQGEYEPENPQGEEPLSVDRLVSVHATKYRPASAEGTFIIPTTFDATERTVPRNTVHTTMNHKVESIFGTGDWGIAGYAVVSPFTKMIAENGLPTKINTVDTWWSLNPGEPLYFPDATLVEAGGREQESLFQVDEENKVIRYKSDNIRAEDLLSLLTDMNHHTRITFIENINTYSRIPFQDYIADEATQAAWDIDKVQAALKEVFGTPEHGVEMHTGFFADFTQGVYGEDSTLDQAIRRIVEEKIAPVGLRSDVDDKETAISQAVEEITHWTEREVIAELNNRAVNMAIERQGFQVERGGMWSWGDSMDVTNKTKALSNALRIQSGSHSSSAHTRVLELYSRHFTSTDPTRSQWGTPFDWKKYSSSEYDELMPELDTQTRRMVYESGLLNARS